MVDDIVGGILPVDDKSTDGEFDPDEFESDDTLDDVADATLDADELPLAAMDDEVDPLLEDII